MGAPMAPLMGMEIKQRCIDGVNAVRVTRFGTCAARIVSASLSSAVTDRINRDHLDAGEACWISRARINSRVPTADAISAIGPRGVDAEVTRSHEHG